MIAALPPEKFGLISFKSFTKYLYCQTKTEQSYKTDLDLLASGQVFVFKGNVKYLMVIYLIF